MYLYVTNNMVIDITEATKTVKWKYVGAHLFKFVQAKGFFKYNPFALIACSNIFCYPSLRCSLLLFCEESQQLSFSFVFDSSISTLQQFLLGLENNFLKIDFFSATNVTSFEE